MTYSYHILAGHIRKRVRERDKNYLGVAVGQTGSGKSATAAQICGTVDESFFDECRVVLTPVEFMETIQDMDKGEAIMFDEAGVGIPAREWMMIQNRMMGYVAQLFRHKNLVVMYTVPSMKFIDTQLRDLMHGIISMKSIDFEKRCSIAKYYKINHDPVFGVTKLEAMEYLGSGGDAYKLDPLYTPHPEDKFWKRYLKKKEDFAANFYAETVEKLKGTNKDGTLDRATIKLYDRQLQSYYTLLQNLTKEMSWKDISVLSGIPARTLQEWTQPVRDERNAASIERLQKGQDCNAATT